MHLIEVVELSRSQEGAKQQRSPILVVRSEELGVIDGS